MISQKGSILTSICEITLDYRKQEVVSVKHCAPNHMLVHKSAIHSYTKAITQVIILENFQILFR